VWLLVGVNCYTAYVEFIAGAALFLGLARDLALYLMGLPVIEWVLSGLELRSEAGFHKVYAAS
jgi:hypothetical protein